MIIINSNTLFSFDAKTWQKVSANALKVQRKTFQDLWKAWRTISQDRFEALQKSLPHWREHVKRWFKSSAQYCILHNKIEGGGVGQHGTPMFYIR